MKLPFDISPREALAAPTKGSQIYVQSVVVLIVSISSILGAGWIILSFCCFRTLRSFRHRLILGLAISDFIMALNFLLSTSMNINNKYIGAPEQAMFCSFNGFTTQVFVIQTDYWVLTISACTYLILAGHKHLTSWVQDHEVMLMVAPWVLSLLWAGIGLKVTGYGDIGAWCWFTSDEVRLFVNFVPRWVIILSILAMYSRLYWVLRKAHRSLLSLGDSSTDPSTPGTNQGDVPMRNTSRSVTTEANQVVRGRYGSEKTVRKLRTTARLMLMYPVAYMLVWTLPTAIRIYQTTAGRPAPFALQTIDKCCIVLQGLVDAVIYGMNEGSKRQWHDLFSDFTFFSLGARKRQSSSNVAQGQRRGESLESNPPGVMVHSDSVSSLDVVLATDSTTRITEAGIKRQG